MSFTPKKMYYIIKKWRAYFRSFTIKFVDMSGFRYFCHVAIRQESTFLLGRQQDGLPHFT
jgi:hypothetical protein